MKTYRLLPVIITFLLVPMVAQVASPVAVPGDSVTVKVTNHPGNLQQNVTFKLSRLDSSERVPISPDSVVISYSTKYTLGFISSSARTERQ
jgi:hypothetical protein